MYFKNIFLKYKIQNNKAKSKSKKQRKKLHIDHVAFFIFIILICFFNICIFYEV